MIDLEQPVLGGQVVDQAEQRRRRRCSRRAATRRAGRRSRSRRPSGRAATRSILRWSLTTAPGAEPARRGRSRTSLIGHRGAHLRSCSAVLTPGGRARTCDDRSRPQPATMPSRCRRGRRPASVPAALSTRRPRTSADDDAAGEEAAEADEVAAAQPRVGASRRSAHRPFTQVPFRSAGDGDVGTAAAPGRVHARTSGDCAKLPQRRQAARPGISRPGVRRGCVAVVMVGGRSLVVGVGAGGCL